MTTTPAPDALPELPDAIRVPIHRIWADAGYLVGRAIAGDKDLAVHTIKALCDEAERAIRAALASQAEKHAAELAKLRQGEPVAWRYQGPGWERWIYGAAPPENLWHEYIVEPLYTSPPPAQPTQREMTQQEHAVMQGALRNSGKLVHKAAQPTQAEPACGCRIGECESKPPPLVCRMTEEIKRGES